MYCVPEETRTWQLDLLVYVLTVFSPQPSRDELLKREQKHVNARNYAQNCSTKFNKLFHKVLQTLNCHFSIAA